MGEGTAGRTVASDRIDLLDWKRRVFDLYREVRATPDPAAAWHRWRDVRDGLIANHSQSPIDPSRRGGFRGTYHEYDPAVRVFGEVRPVDPEDASIPMSRDDGTRFMHFADAAFELEGRS